MEQQASDKRIKELEEQVRQLQQANIDLINRNLQLGQQIDAYYDVGRENMRKA